MTGAIKRFFNTLPGRITLVVSLGMTLVIALELFMSYRVSTSTTDRIEYGQLETLLTYGSRDYAQYIAELSSYSLTLRNDDAFLSKLSSQKSEMDYELDSDIRAKLKFMFYSRPDLESLTFYLPQFDRAYTLSRSNANLRVLESPGMTEAEWYQNASSGPNFIWFSPEAAVEQEESPDFSLYRAIINIADQRTVAVVKMTVRAENFVRLFPGEDRYVCVFDGEGRLFYRDGPMTASEMQLIYDRLPEGEEPSRFTAQAAGIDCLVVGNSAVGQGWTVAFLVPTAHFNALARSMWRLFFLVGAATVLLSALLIMVLIKSQTASLARLMIQVGEIGGQNFTGRVREEGPLESVNLAQSINAMLDRIAELVEQNYVSDINEKSARLAALEAQLNPHFLYNTLQAVSTRAVMTGNMDVAGLIDALADNLRYLIKANIVVRAKDELKYLDNYFLLQKARFGDRLEVTINAEKTARRQYIPKMTIQTLAENAVQHGLEESSEAIHIDISLFLEQDELCLQVKDNGVGMTRARLEAVREKMCNAEWFAEHDPSIGLANLYGRLKLLYSGQASIQIESEAGQGTVVTIRLPCDD